MFVLVVSFDCGFVSSFALARSKKCVMVMEDTIWSRLTFATRVPTIRQQGLSHSQYAVDVVAALVRRVLVPVHVEAGATSVPSTSDYVRRTSSTVLTSNFYTPYSRVVVT